VIRLEGGVPVDPLPLTAPGLRAGQMVRSLVSRRGQPGLVLCDGPDRALFEAAPGGMRHVGPLLTRALLTAVSADLDRDGVDEVWVADDQSVLLGLLTRAGREASPR
jgi:hypothetical protein